MNDPKESGPQGAGNIPEIRPYCIFKGQRVYSRAAVMRLLNKSDRTMRRYVALGKIRAISIGMDSTDLSFFERDIEAFLTRKK